MTKVAIVYYSQTGNVASMAKRLADTAESKGAEVRLLAVSREGEQAEDQPQQPTADDIVWADVVLFGSPTRYGNVAGRLKVFIDSLGAQWQQGLLADKVYAGFTSTATAHGGQETTLLALYNSIYHFGGIIVPPGYTDPLKFVDGNPYGVSFVAGQENGPLDEPTLNALDHLATRVIAISGKLTA